MGWGAGCEIDLREDYQVRNEDVKLTTQGVYHMCLKIRLWRIQFTLFSRAHIFRALSDLTQWYT